MINLSSYRRSILVGLYGVTNFNHINEYPFGSMISKIGICKPKIKTLTKKKERQKMGKQKRTSKKEVETVLISKSDREKLERGLKEKANIWKPEVGEKLFGVVTEIKSVTKKFGKKEHTTRLCIVGKEDDTRVGVWLTTVLETKFLESKIVEGSLVAFEYLGEVKKGKNQTYHNYNVATI